MTPYSPQQARGALSIPRLHHPAFGHLFERVTSDTQSDYPAWRPDATYTAGDRVTNVGRAWECLLEHGPERQGTWAPGVAHTVWTDHGPA